MSPHHYTLPTVTYLGSAHAANQAPATAAPKPTGKTAPQTPATRA